MSVCGFDLEACDTYSLEVKSRLIKSCEDEVFFCHFNMISILVHWFAAEPPLCVGGRYSWLSIFYAKLVFTLDDDIHTSNRRHSLSLNDHAFNHFKIDSHVLV